MLNGIKSFRWLALIGLLSLWSCAAVNTDYDRSANFAQYKTFAWMNPDIKVGTNPKYNSDLINRNIQYAVETEFAKRGIMKDNTNPDFLVGYHTYTEKKQQNYGGYGYPYSPYFGGWGWRGFGGWGFPYYPYGYGGYNSYPRTYTEGTLIIDVVDNQTKQLVWRGSVDGNVDNIARLQKQIQKGVQAIMKKYPAPVTLPERHADPMVS